jgi:hypothetical protein
VDKDFSFFVASPYLNARAALDGQHGPPVGRNRSAAPITRRDVACTRGQRWPDGRRQDHRMEHQCKGEVALRISLENALGPLGSSDYYPKLRVAPAPSLSAGLAFVEGLKFIVQFVH